LHRTNLTMAEVAGAPDPEPTTGYTTPPRRPDPEQNEFLHASGKKLQWRGADARARTSSPSKVACGVCACQLCSCGKHQCRETRPRVPFEGQRKQDFPAHPVESYRGALSPPPAQRRQAKQVPFTGSSSHKSDYPAWDKAAYASALPKERPPPPEREQLPLGPAREDHPEFGAEAYRQALQHRLMTAPKPAEPRPFSGESSHKADYRRFNSGDYKQAFQPSPKPKQRPQQPFEGTSSHKSDYKAHPTESYREAHVRPPAAQPKRAAVPFEGKSHHKEHYQPYHPQTYKQQAAQPARAPAARREPVPFEGESHVKTDFGAYPTAHYAEALRPAPDREAARPRPAFAGESSHRADFKAFSPRQYAQALTPAPEAAGRREPLRLEGESSTKTDYPAHGVEHYKEARKQSTLPRSATTGAIRRGSQGGRSQPRQESTFSGQRKDDHPRFDVSHYREALSPAPLQRVEKKQLPFEGQSTYASTHVQHYVEPPKPLPRQAQERPQLPFEGQTSHARDFPAHPPQAYQESLSYGQRSASAPRTSTKVPFAGQSHVKADHPRFDTEHYRRALQGSPPPQSRQREPDSRTFQTEAREAHAPKELPVQPKFQPPARRTPPKFEGSSSYKDSFVHHKVEQAPAGWKCTLDRYPTQPPTFKPGREHHFYDESAKTWY